MFLQKKLARHLLVAIEASSSRHISINILQLDKINYRLNLPVIELEEHTQGGRCRNRFFLYYNLIYQIKWGVGAFWILCQVNPFRRREDSLIGSIVSAYPGTLTPFRAKQESVTLHNAKQKPPPYTFSHKRRQNQNF